MSLPVLVVRTGTANLASVLAGLRRIGASPEPTSDPDRVAGADRVVLPGVGAFGAAMARLRESRLDEAIEGRVREGRPTLAICLGLQLLCEGSEESPGVPGLGIVPGVARRFPEGVLVPQLGWNRVLPLPDSRFLVLGHAYYANSYRLPEIPDGWSGAVTEHGGPFAAALEKGDVLACQFHPELSGAWGRKVLGHWLGMTHPAAEAEIPC